MNDKKQAGSFRLLFVFWESLFVMLMHALLVYGDLMNVMLSYL